MREEGRSEKENEITRRASYLHVVADWGSFDRAHIRQRRYIHVLRARGKMRRTTRQEDVRERRRLPFVSTNAWPLYSLYSFKTPSKFLK